MHKLKYILAFFLLFSLLGSHNFLSADDEPTPESCFSFEQYTSGKMSIIWYNVNLVEWCGYNVVIPNTYSWMPITKIWESAFAGKQLTSVMIPNSVINFWDYAFNNNSLTTLVLPNAITTMWRMAFSNNSLTSLTIPNGVKEIWYYAFSNNNLTSVTIPGSVKNIVGYAFENNQITSVVLWEWVDQIFDWAFSSNNLQDIFLPKTITYLGFWVFSDNPAFSLTFWSGTKNIRYASFKNIKLSSLTLPEGLETIWYDAFNGSDLTSVVIPNSVTSIESYAFANNKLESVTLSKWLTTIAQYAFMSNKLTSLEIPDSVIELGDGSFSSNQLTSVVIPNSVTTLWEAVFASNQLTSVTLPESITRISNSAFRNNKLTEFTIPAWITSIWDYALEWNQLASIEIPDSVVSIWNYAFYHNNFTSVYIPSSVISIGGGAFENNFWLSSVTLSEWLETIWNTAFKQNNLTTIILPESLQSIWYNAFAYNKLTSIIIPSSVVSIWNSAFYNNKLTSIFFNWGNISIWYDAFWYQNWDSYLSWLSYITWAFSWEYVIFERTWTKSVPPNSPECFGINEEDGEIISYNKLCWAEIVIPQFIWSMQVKSIWNNVFEYKEVTSVVFPEWLEKIWESAFARNQITSLVIPNSVEYIWDYAFSTNRLMTIILPAWLSSINRGTFFQNDLTSVLIPNSVSYIWDNAFYNNQLTEVTIPSAVEYIWDYAFSNNLLWTISLGNREVEMGYDAFIPHNACTSQNGFTYTVGKSWWSYDDSDVTYQILDPQYQHESSNMKSMFVKAYKYHDGSFDTAIAYSTWYIKETEIYLSDFINTFDEWIYQLEYGNILSSYTNICKEITGSSLENSLDTNLKIVIVGGDGKAQLRAYTKDPKKIFFWSHGGVSMSGEYAYSVKNISLSLVENGTSSTPEVCYVNTEDEENLDGCQDAMEDLYNANTNMLDNWEGYIKVDYTDLFGYSDYFVISDFVSYESDQKIYISNFSKDGDWNSYSLYVQKEEIDDEGYWSGYWSWNNDGSQKWHWGDNMCDPAWEFDFTDGYQTWYEVWRLQKEQNEQKNAREYQQVWYENGYQDWLFQWCISWYYNTDEYEINWDEYWDGYNEWYDEGNPHDDEDGESSSMTVTAIDKNGESFALEEVRDLDECESEIWCFMDDGDIMVKILSDKNIVKLLVNLWEEDEESTVYLSYDYKDVGESLGWYLSLNHFFAPKTHNDDAKWVTFVREVNFEQLRDWYEMGELYVTPTLSVSTKESKEDAYQTRDDFDKSKLFICNTKLQNFDNIEKNIDCYWVDERPQLDAGGGTYYIYGLQWLFYTDPKFLKVNVKFELYEKPYYGCTESCD